MMSEETIVSRFQEVVARFPENTALREGDVCLSYRALGERVCRVAALLERTMAPGNDCVAIVAEHSAELVIATLGVLHAGKIVLAIHPELPDPAVRAILADAAPSLVLATATTATRTRTLSEGLSRVLLLEATEARDASERPPSVVAADDIATIVYTSGSSGAPKGVMKSHRAILHRVALAREYDGVSASDRQSLLTHSSFSAAYVDVFGALLSGATLCLFDVMARGFSALARWIDEERITILHPPVLLFRRFLASLAGENLFPHLRLVALAGDAVTEADVRAWKRHFAPSCVLSQRFSTTETGLLTVACVTHATDLDAPGALAGYPVRDISLVLVDDAGGPTPPGEVGTLLARGRYLAAGYFGDPEKSRAAFGPVGAGSDEFTYATGDRGRFLADGRFAFLGRRDREVKIRGYRVDLCEVEGALRALPAVSDAAVVSVLRGDERRLVAFIVPAGGGELDMAALGAALATTLPPWKVPAEFRAIDSVPSTLTGKVDSARLEAVAHEPIRTGAQGRETPAGTMAAGASFDDAPVSSGSLERALGELWAAALGVPTVDPNTDFIALGGNSISALTVLVEIERAYGVRLRPADLYRAGSVRRLAALVEGRAPSTRALGRARVSTPTESAACVVPMQTGGERPPFFFVHGWGGSVLPLLELSRALGPEQPSWGLQTLEPTDGGAPWTVERVAKQHVERLLALDPSGPYSLGGYSLGGILAYEMAQQLRTAGKCVALLALFDATPSRLPLRLFLEVHANYWRVRTKHHGRQLLAGRVDRRLKYFGERVGTIVRTLRGQRPHEAANHDPFAVAVGRYEPKPFAGATVLFVASEQRKDLRSAWRHLVPHTLKVETIPGSHEALLEPPQVEALAARLSEHLGLARYRSFAERTTHSSH